jgi:hypothetical protein
VVGFAEGFDEANHQGIAKTVVRLNQTRQPNPKSADHLSSQPKLSVDEFIDVLVRSTLASCRPIHDRQATLMLAQADIIHARG